NVLSFPSLCTLSLHDALPIFLAFSMVLFRAPDFQSAQQIFINISTFHSGFSLPVGSYVLGIFILLLPMLHWCSAKLAINHRCGEDRKSTRLNSSHVKISYAVF